MKKLIFRSFLKDILTFFVLSTLSLSLVVWVIQSVNYLDLVSEDGHSLKVYFLYTLFTLPKIISKILMFSFFISIFYILLKYEENNEILVYWIHGIKKIDFINNILKLSIIVLIIQLLLNLFIVPKTLDTARSYLRSSNIDYFPSLIKSKKFIDAVNNLTIFIERKNSNGEFENIFLKDKYSEENSQIISAKKGRIIKRDQEHLLILDEGKIINIDEKKVTNIKFSKTEFNLSKYTTQSTVWPKVQELKTSDLINCIKFIQSKNNLRFSNQTKIYNCDTKNLNSILQETSKRIIKPIYILIVTLISSLIILRSKDEKNSNFYKMCLFFLGIIFITIYEITSSSIEYYSYKKNIFIVLPFILIIFSYLILIIKTTSTRPKKI